MLRSISSVGALLLAQQVNGYCDSYYGNCNGNNWGYGGYNRGGGLTYTGLAMGKLENGEFGMIPVSECPHGCALNNVCGTESECEIGSIVLIIVLSIFGCIFTTVGCVFCCVCCGSVCKGICEGGSSDNAKTYEEPLLDKEAEF